MKFRNFLLISVFLILLSSFATASYFDVNNISYSDLSPGASIVDTSPNSDADNKWTYNTLQACNTSVLMYYSKSGTYAESGNAAEVTATIDTSGLTPGTYNLSLYTTDDTISESSRYGFKYKTEDNASYTTISHNSGGGSCSLVAYSVGQVEITDNDYIIYFDENTAARYSVVQAIEFIYAETGPQNFTFSSNVNEFSIFIDNTTYNTTNGQITTHLLTNSSNLYNITVGLNDFTLNETLLDINISSDYAYTFYALNVTAKDYLTNNPINDFTVNLNKSSFNENITTSTGNATFYLINGSNYFINVTSSGYNYFNETVLLNGHTQKEVTLSSFNTVKVNVYNLSSNLLINTSNVTVDFDLNGTVTTIKNDTGEFLFTNLTPGNYSVDINTEGFETGFYSVTVGFNSFQTLNAYLLPTANTDVIFTALDESTGKAVESTTVTVEYEVNNSFQVILSLSTDISGRIKHAFDPDGKYRYTFAKSDFETKVFILDPIIFNSYNVRLTPLVIQEDNSDYSTVKIETYPGTYYNNEINEFSILFSSATGTLTYYNYSIIYPGGSYTGFGSNVYGERLNQNINITNASSTDKVYLHYAYILSSGQVKEFTKTYTIANPNSSFFTTVDNKGNKYNLPLLDRLLIVTFVILIASGLAYAVGGIEAAGVLAMFIYGYFVKIELVPEWSLIPSMVIIFIIIAKMRD